MTPVGPAEKLNASGHPNPGSLVSFLRRLRYPFEDGLVIRRPARAFLALEWSSGQHSRFHVLPYTGEV